LSLRELLRRPLVVRVGQLAVTGDWNHAGYRRLAELISAGPHSSVLDLGSGRSPLLRHLSPERYAGLDLHAPDLAYAQRHHGRPGYEFVQADILTQPLDRWRGVDLVTASSVFHHLTDEQVVALVERIAEQVAPNRMAFLDGVATGRLGGLVTRLDYGEPTRSKQQLWSLLRPRFEIENDWGYDVPFGTFHLFGFELRPDVRD
jgi:SAM-dependent methyltransferase